MAGPVGEDQAVAVLAECGENARGDLQGALFNGHGVSFAILTPGGWDEVASYTEFVGSTQPRYSVRDADEPIGGEMGHVSCFLRNGDRVFLTYSMTGRGTEAASGSVALPDMTPYGRGEAWQTSPDGWPGGHYPCRYWRSDRPGTPPGSGQPPRVAADRPGATPAETLGRNGHHH